MNQDWKIKILLINILIKIIARGKFIFNTSRTNYQGPASAKIWKNGYDLGRPA